MKLIRTIIHRFPYLPVLIVALILRVWGLGLNPVGLVHDEIHDIINAKSMALFGQVAPGTVAGILTKNGFCNGNCVFGELGTVLLVPWMWLMPMNIFWVKIPFAAASIAIVFFTGKLMENLSRKKTIGLLTGLLVAISPWAIHFGRTAYENLLAYGLFWGSLYLWTKAKAGNKEAGGATLLGLFGSMAYFGAKVIWLPLMILGIIYWKFNNKHRWQQALVWGVVTVLLVVSYGLILSKTEAGKRGGELNWINSKTTETVNKERKQTMPIPMGVEKIISNKATVTIRNIGQKYLEIFSIKYLLSEGENVYDNFSIPDHGYVYLIEMILAVVGFGAMFKLSLKGWLFVTGLLLIIPIPGALNNTAVTFALRDGMIFPVISGVAATGWWWLLTKTKYSKMVNGVIGAGLLVSLIFFEIIYWYRMPFQKSAGYVFHERAMTNYVKLLREKTNQKIEITVSDPVDVWYEYAFFTGSYNNSTWAKDFNTALKKYPYEIDGIKIIRECPTVINEDTIYLWERDRGCVPEPNSLTRISEPRDGGARFFIENDIVCTNVKLSSYPFPRKITDFEVEKMSTTDFCQKWVSKP